MTRDTKALKVVNQNTALTAESDNPWSEIGTAHGTQTLLKYVKGEWSIGEEEVPLGTKYVAFIDELAQAFIKFNEDEAPEVHLAKVKFGRDNLPKREDLGELDREEWEVVDGKPKDPFQPIMQLPLSPVNRIGELVVFSAIGEGGARSAVADLCGIYGRSPRNGYLPIIELGTSSYKHKKYGTVHVPGPDAYDQIPALGERGRARLQHFFAMLDGRLAKNEFVCGPEFTVADITGLITIDFAGWAKIKPPEQMPHLHRWHAAVSARPSAKA